MVLFSLGIILAVCCMSEASVCTGDSDCGVGECCYIEPEYMVVSRRQLELPAMIDAHSDTGVCERYKLSNESCGVLEVLNGHCGCTSDQSCQWVPEPTIAVKPTEPSPIIVKRKMAPHDGPGAYKCVCENYRIEGENCAPLETANGHCGCGEGMSCQWIPDRRKRASKRSMVAHEEPGSYKCATTVE